VRREGDVTLEALVAGIDAIVPGTPAPDTVPTGFPSLDRVLGGGLRRQDLVVLGGDVGSGKSALALAMAVRAALSGVPTLFLSGEMTPERVLERALALEGRAPVDDLRQGRLDAATRAAAGAAAVRLRDIPLLLRPLLGASFEEIPASLEQAPGRALLVVDSLQLMPSPRHSRVWQSSGISPSWRSRSCPVIGPTGPTPGRRWTTSARWAPSNTTRIWCWGCIGRRCIGRHRAWRGRRS